MRKMTAQEKAEKVYNLAADSFDHPALAFWDRIGRRAVAFLELQPGMQVLDVCCGTGASAIPAAEKVGPQGHVTGVDLAENQLELARRKVKAAGLNNIVFAREDMTRLPFAEGSYDAVTIVFGIFFVKEMEEQVGRLWRLVKPGGRLVLVTWGPRIFEPAYSEWLKALKEQVPEMSYDSNPWDGITTVEAVRTLLEKGVRLAGEGGSDERAGIEGADIEGAGKDRGTDESGGGDSEATHDLASIDVIAEMSVHSLREVEDFWRIAMGTGMRWPIELMGKERAEQLKAYLLDRLEKLQVKEVETNVIYGVLKKGRRPEQDNNT